MRPPLALALALVSLVAACAEEPFRCPEPRISLRNPSTIVCEPFHVPSMVCPDEAEPPTWAACGACTQVPTQADCLAAPGCRAIYDSCFLDGEVCIREQVYLGCVGVDRAGPQPGACGDLDAESCSSRDDCAAWFQHHPTCNQPPDEPRPAFYQPQNGTCVLLFWGCLAEPVSPIT